MTHIEVESPSRTYTVYVGHNILDESGSLVRAAAGGTTAFIVSDTNVAPLYFERVRQSFTAAGYHVFSAVVLAGEQRKNMSQLSSLLEIMAKGGLTRDDVVVALGGGVIGDLAGFAAAVYMRGCQIVQIPTSLLAMVDSSVGGKTAVDLSAGKNLAGAFLQPSIVIADTACLDTIAPELLKDSFGEIIKYGVMADKNLFSALETTPLTAQKAIELEPIICRCIEIKRDVVCADEKESGIREKLNLGHTIGHAIEAQSAYTKGHGACVATGLVLMAHACCHLGICEANTAKRIENLVAAHNLPTSTDISVDELYMRSLSDKKRHGNQIRLVEIHDIAQVSVEQVTLERWKEILTLACGKTVQDRS